MESVLKAEAEFYRKRVTKMEVAKYLCILSKNMVTVSITCPPGHVHSPAPSLKKCSSCCPYVLFGHQGEVTPNVHTPAHLRLTRW